MEANLTNKLLQAIAHGGLSGDSSDEAVQRARNGEQIGAATSSGSSSSTRAPREKRTSDKAMLVVSRLLSVRSAKRRKRANAAIARLVKNKALQ